jgi:hypothetical protein
MKCSICEVEIVAGPAVKRELVTAGPDLKPVCLRCLHQLAENEQTEQAVQQHDNFVGPLPEMGSTDLF